MSKPKKFVVSGVEYTVTIGGSNVKISRPGFATLAPSTNEVAGYSVYDDGEDFAVLPSHVAKWIRKNSWRFEMKGEKTIALREASVDDIMEYRASNGITTECGIKIWGIKSSPNSLIPHRYVVLLTELPDNHSVSVTNSVEDAALEVMESYLTTADPETIVWVEHYPVRGNSRSVRIPESFDLVHLRFDGHQFRLNTSITGQGWKRLSEQDLKELGIV
jgi:hypothetical protein